MKVKILAADAAIPYGMAKLDRLYTLETADQLQLPLQFRRPVLGKAGFEIWVPKALKDNFQPPPEQEKVEIVPVAVEEPPTLEEPPMKEEAPAAKEEKEPRLRPKRPKKRRRRRRKKWKQKKAEKPFRGIKVDKPVEIPVVNPVTFEHFETLIIDEVPLRKVVYREAPWGMLRVPRCTQFGKPLASWKNLEINNFKNSGIKIVGFEKMFPAPIN